MSNKNPSNLFTSETGRINQKKSAKAKVENRTIAETVRTMMKAPVTDKGLLKEIAESGIKLTRKPTYLDYFLAKCVQNSIKQGNLETVQKLMDIYGETATNADSKQENAFASLLGAITGNNQ